VAALAFLIFGALLVYEGNLPAGDLTQSARTIGGALFLALGLTIPAMVLKSRGKWKKPSRNYRSL
jgi:hypothetical protein